MPDLKSHSRDKKKGGSFLAGPYMSNEGGPLNNYYVPILASSIHKLTYTPPH